MPCKTTRVITEAFTEAGIRHECLARDTYDILCATFQTDNAGPVTVRIFLPQEGDEVLVRIHALLCVPAHCRTATLELINRLHLQHRCVRFVLDEDDNVNMEYDFSADCTHLGQAACKICLRMVTIANLAYAQFLAHPDHHWRIRD